MKKMVFAFLIVCALFICVFSCLADALFVPNGIREIKEEAFTDVPSFDSAFFPKSVKSIHESALSGRVSTIYGYPGSPAEAFAKSTGRTFIAVSVPETEDFFIPVSSIMLLSDMGNTIIQNESLQLTAISKPETHDNSSFYFVSMHPDIALAGEDGAVSGISAGRAQILCFSKDGSGAYAHYAVNVLQGIEEISLSESSVTLSVGEKHTLSHTIFPDDALGEVLWYTDNSSIASVSASGVVTAKSGGTCYVYAKSELNQNVYARCKITVLNDQKTLVMPLRQTDVDGVSANLARIESVKSSAFLELENLYARGKISYSIMNKRKTVIENAFSMYSFPWMTKSYQPYWKAANSENGAKDFKPGIVYYGLPYISDYQNRLYNVQKAVSENRFTPAAKGYYLNQNKLLNGKYVGNDCSSMLSISFFGFTSQTADFNTNTFHSSTLFTTLSSSETLMPGDILVRGGRHVVMFLYYADSQKSKIVVIEQGGNEPGINTVSTSIYPISYYYQNGYIPRRLAGWT